MFCKKGDLGQKKTSSAEETLPNSKATDDFLDILKKIYNLIKTSGSRGIEYREIIKKLDLKKQSTKKLEDYLLSHYCRKLANIGLIEIQSKAITKKTNIRYAFDCVYLRQPKRKDSLDNEALGKLRLR